MKSMNRIFISLIALCLVSTVAYAEFDRKVKVSSNDSTAGYLNGKIVAGSNTTIVENNNGGDESIQINAVTSGSGIILDLDDDGNNESTAFTELATSNDPDNIVTEPSADKVLFDFSPVILETELEAELETQIGVGVFTPNDGALNDDNLSDNSLSDLTDITTTAPANAQVLLWDGVGDNRWENKALSGDCTITEAGVLSCTALSEWNDVGAYLEPKTDGDGIELSDSGGTKGVRISHDGTNVVIDIVGAGAYKFPGLVGCDTIDTDGTGVASCGADASGAGGTPNILDLGDDGADESADLVEIATVGDTNSIFTEPAADKLRIDMGNNWPTSDTADALSANGANCGAGQYPLGVDAAGAVESCTTDDDVPEVGDFDALVGGSYTTYDTVNDDMDLDDEVVTHMLSINIFDPTTADTNRIQAKLATAVTISRVSCSTDTGTATIQLDERAEGTPNSAGTDVLSAGLVCDNDTQSTTGFDNAGIAADVPLNLQITATASSPTVVRIHIDYKVDDV